MKLKMINTSKIYFQKYLISDNKDESQIRNNIKVEFWFKKTGLNQSNQTYRFFVFQCKPNIM